MRRIVIGLMSTLSGLVLLFSYHTSTNSGTSLASGSTGSGSTGSGSTGSGSTSSGSTGSTGSSGSSGSTGSSSSGTGSGTFTGDAVMTRWGVVQVEITVKSGKIVKSRAVQYPNGNGRDVEINDYALPILDQEAVKASSANIDAIGGATVTSEGYIQSLQSAVDQAHL